MTSAIGRIGYALGGRRAKSEANGPWVAQPSPNPTHLEKNL